MPPDDIGKAYNQITHLWQRADFDRSNGMAQHHRAIAFAKGRGRALDIGCGCTGRFIDLMEGEGFTPAGLDISSEMLKLARQRHPQIDFVEADICSYCFPDQYDFITAWDSLWHVPLAQQRAVVSKIVQSLSTGGVLIFSFGGTEGEDAHTNSAMGPEVYYATLGIQGYIKLCLQLGCVIRHLEFDQYPELHAYLIVEKCSVE